jgi:oxaloacetate decarboxylase gamma subunit
MEAGLIGQGLELMLAGMGTVFVFLTCLVGATTLMSRLVTRFEKPVEANAEGVSAEEVAAITAAIARHRRTD